METLMFENSYWLVLLLIFPVLWKFNKSKYYAKVSSSFFMSSKKMNVGKILSYFIILYLFLASIGISIQYENALFSQEKRHYILVNDGSLSMVSAELTEPLLRANYIFLDLLKTSNFPDTVGSIVFSDNAFIVSYLLDDVDFTIEKLKRVKWDQYPLNLGTSVENALWTSFLISMKKYPDKLNLSELKNGLSGKGIDADLSHIPVLKFKEYLKGTCLILFTDGYFSPNPLSKSGLSPIKIMDMLRKVGVIVYIIDLEPPNVQLIESGFVGYVKDTGGDMIYAKQQSLSDVYKKIFEIESAPRYTKRIERSSLSQIFGISALICFTIWYIIKTQTSV